MKKNIIIVGGSSYLGTKLIKKINKKKYSVYSTYFNNFIVNNKINHIKFNVLKFKKKDLMSFPKIVDNLIILSWCDLNDYESNRHVLFSKKLNYFTKNILSYSKIREINVLGSCQEYGIVNGEISEDHECIPTTMYAKSKLDYYRKIKNYQQTYKFNFNWLRLFYMYGDNRNRGIWSKFMEAKKNKQVFKMSTGDQKFDFLHVNTIIKYINLIIFKKRSFGVINICSGRPTKLSDLVKKWSERYNVKLLKGFYPYNKYEGMEYWGSNQKLKEILSRNA